MDDSKVIRFVKVGRGGQVVWILRRFHLVNVKLLVSVRIAEKNLKETPVSGYQDSFQVRHQE
jgi:hypothetical protein